MLVSKLLLNLENVLLAATLFYMFWSTVPVLHVQAHRLHSRHDWRGGGGAKKMHERKKRETRERRE